MTINSLKMNPALFDIPRAVWETIEFDDIQATYADMLGARLVDPPYLHFFIRVPLRDFLVAVKNYAERTEGPLGDVDAFSDEITQFFGKSLIGEYVFKRHPDKDDYQMAVRLFLGDVDKQVPFQIVTGMPTFMCEQIESFLYKCLITLLVTKNSVRKTVQNSPKSPSKQARADSKRFSTTTYISIGKITETMRGSSGSRGPVRPHLRRGHIRRQRFGEGRSEVKTIFIAPSFVNADREWIADRKKYKIVA